MSLSKDPFCESRGPAVPMELCHPIHSMTSEIHSSFTHLAQLNHHGPRRVLVFRRQASEAGRQTCHAQALGDVP